MEELEREVIDRAREWYYARKAVEDGANINWIDFNADLLHDAVEELIEAEENPRLTIFICF